MLGSPRWTRLCRCTGGTVTRRCTPAATSILAVESTCSSLTTLIHSGAPRVFTTECITPDKPGYRHRGEPRGVFVHICVTCAMAGCICVQGVTESDTGTIPENTTRGRQSVTWKLDFEDWTETYVLFVS